MAHYNLAYTLGAMGDVDGARKHMQLAVAADPQNEGAREALEALNDADKIAADDTSDRKVEQAGHWVPYVESGGESSALTVSDLSDAAPQASFEHATVSDSVNRSAGEATRAIHNRARQMLHGRIAAAKERTQQAQEAAQPE